MLDSRRLYVVEAMNGVVVWWLWRWWEDGGVKRDMKQVTLVS